MALAKKQKNTVIVKPPKKGQADHTGFKKFVKALLINDNKILIKRNSALASRDKTLYDVAIQGELNKEEDYLAGLVRLFKNCTGQDLKFEDNNQDSNRCVETPKIYLNEDKKEITYIYFIRYDASPTKEFVHHKSIESVEFVSLDKFVKLFLSKKFVKHSETYQELVRLSLCETFDIGTTKKDNRYHRKVN